MIEALARFAEALRREGVSASPAELVDAARALQSFDLADRGRFKAALRATLAKDRKQALAFDRIFDGFFAPPARAGGKGKTGHGGAFSGERRVARGLGGAAPRPKPLPPPPGEPRARQRTPPRAEEPRREKDRRPSEQRLDQIRRGESARRGRLKIVRAPRAAREHGTSLRELSAAEEARLAREIPRLLQEIRLRSARRYARARRGRLWPARVFRANLATGGVPFVLPLRARRRHRPRVVLLVDVSWSTARAAGFFLWIASEFLRVGRETRVLAFVDRPVEITATVARWSPRSRAKPAGAAGAPGRRRKPLPGTGIARGGVSFADILEHTRELDLNAPSDYGRAFHGLLTHGLPRGGRDTVLVILGDGRSNRFDPLPWTIDEIARRCRAVIWLVPEPAARWGTGDSRLADYLSCVDVLVEADDLDGIARGVAEILRRV